MALGLVLALASLPVPREVAAQDLTVSAAISLKDALEEIAAAFEGARPGVHVNLNLGASGDLQRQIEAGAPVDVFFSAATRNMDLLQQRGAVEARTRRDVACNRLVVVTRVDETGIATLEELESAERIAIGTPKSVPAGQYAKEALEAAGLWSRLHERYVFAENVRQALEYVKRGETEAGFVYRTDAAAGGEDVRIAFEVDRRLHGAITYPAAVVAGSRRRALAREFVEFVAGAGGQAALERHGFPLAPCGIAEDDA
ncbi:MAG: molybdate ABC transporter substrate-binding protein [Gemmatimonadetes bacterium]|nr:molybdate ABC transporter substrate-binding protein [Gemmatimonadota bacterium]